MSADDFLYALAALWVVLAAWASFRSGEKEGFQRGWIAGVDYEKQRRKDNPDAE